MWENGFSAPKGRMVTGFYLFGGFYFLLIWEMAREKEFYHIHPAKCAPEYSKSFGAMLFKYKFTHSFNTF